jgi:hypothetical protein
LPIVYADDTTLHKTINSPNSINSINQELEHVNLWLKINKLSLNASKTRYMVFHKPRKRLPTLNISIDNENVERCISFNYLGIHLNQNLTRNDHIKRTSLKIARATGRINCLKHFLPKKILLTLYNSLILPHLTYGILAWGAKSNDIAKLQKKSVRIITASKYNAHTEPLFKAHHLLKIEDIYKVYQLNFYFKWKNGNLPKYFNSFSCNTNRDTHYYRTRTTSIVSARVNHEFAKHSLKHSLIILLNQTPNIITDKITTHSYHGFSSYVKNYYINTYTNVCYNSTCYICRNQQQLL